MGGYLMDCANRFALRADDSPYREYCKDKGYINAYSSGINTESPYIHKNWDKLDAYYKWCACLNMFEDVRWVDTSMKVVDLGSGDGPICHIISDMGYNVVGVDVKPWSYPYKSLVQMVLRGAETVLREYEDESVDIFIDGCAVTHFNPNHEPDIPNKGWKNIFDSVARVMKPTGHFIVTSDVMYQGTEHNGEFISPEQIIEMAESSGLKLTSEFDYDRTNAIRRSEDQGELAVANFDFIKA